MTRVLVLSPEPLRARMAGMGLRARQIARALAAEGHQVSLAAPYGSEPGSVAPLPLVAFETGEFRDAAEAAGVAVVSGHAGDRLYPISGFQGALVADLYDPFLIENLAYHETLGPRVFENDRGALERLLARADLVLAASEDQRLFWLGALLGRRRLSPAALAGDPDARNVVAVAPFAIEEPPPPEARSHPDLPRGPHDVLFGGVYDWYDPLLVVSAWPRVLDAVPTARLIFCESPNPGTTPQVLLSAVKTRALELGLLGSAIHVLPWVAFEDRGPWLRSFRAAVVAHRPSLETTLSFRTRVIEALWASLPVVSTPGGAASELLEKNGAGLVVPAGPEALAEALVSVLSNPATHAALVANATRLARSFAPRVALDSLLSFVASPRKLPVSPPATSSARRLLRKVLGR